MPHPRGPGAPIAWSKVELPYPKRGLRTQVNKKTGEIKYFAAYTYRGELRLRALPGPMRHQAQLQMEAFQREALLNGAKRNMKRKRKRPKKTRTVPRGAYDPLKYIKEDKLPYKVWVHGTRSKDQFATLEAANAFIDALRAANDLPGFKKQAWTERPNSAHIRVNPTPFRFTKYGSGQDSSWATLAEAQQARDAYLASIGKLETVKRTAPPKVRWKREKKPKVIPEKGVHKLRKAQRAAYEKLKMLPNARITKDAAHKWRLYHDGSDLEPNAIPIDPRVIDALVANDLIILTTLNGRDAYINDAASGVL